MVAKLRKREMFKLNLKLHFWNLHMRKYFTETYSVKFSFLCHIDMNHMKKLQNSCLIFYHIIFLIRFNFTEDSL